MKLTTIVTIVGLVPIHNGFDLRLPSCCHHLLHIFQPVLGRQEFFGTAWKTVLPNQACLRDPCVRIPDHHTTVILVIRRIHLFVVIRQQLYVFFLVFFYSSSIMSERRCNRAFQFLLLSVCIPRLLPKVSSLVCF